MVASSQEVSRSIEAPDFLTSMRGLESGFRSSATSAEATLSEARRPCYVFEQHLGQGIKIIIEFSGEKPRWFEQVVTRIIELLDLPSNWDSYKARPVNIDSVRTALQILFWTMQPEIPSPQIIPTARGTVQLEWHLHGVDLEVEALPSGLLHISYEDSVGGELIEDETTSSLIVVAQALAKILERK